MLVEGVMKRRVLVVEPDARLALAACTMRDQDIGCLPVVEDGRLIGMVDIAVRGVAGGLDPHRATVRAVMSASAIACRVHDTVEEACDLMAANLIKHLPLVDRRKRVVEVAKVYLSLRSIRATRYLPRSPGSNRTAASPAGRRPPTLTRSRSG